MQKYLADSNSAEQGEQNVLQLQRSAMNRRMQDSNIPPHAVLKDGKLVASRADYASSVIKTQADDIVSRDLSIPPQVSVHTSDTPRSESLQ